MKARTLIAMAALTVFIITPAAAGTIFEMTIKDAAGTEIAKGRTTVEGKLLRVDSELAGEQASSSVIFRGDRQEAIFLNHAQSQAMVIDRAGMEKMAAQMQKMHEQMQQALANVPPSQREMMEKMMKDRMGGMMGEPPAPIEVRKTSETGTTNGYPWVKYEVYQEGAKIREHLVTNYSNLKIDASTFGVFKEMGYFFESLSEAFGSSLAMAQENPFDEMSILDGFPVVTRDFENGALTNQSELTAVTTGDVDGGLFENPGYKVQKLEMPEGR